MKFYPDPTRRENRYELCHLLNSVLGRLQGSKREQFYTFNVHRSHTLPGAWTRYPPAFCSPRHLYLVNCPCGRLWLALDIQTRSIDAPVIPAREAATETARDTETESETETHTHIHTYTRIVQIMILTDPSQWVMLFDALKAETRKSTEKHVHVYCSAADVRFDD